MVCGLPAELPTHRGNDGGARRGGRLFINQSNDWFLLLRGSILCRVGDRQFSPYLFVGSGPDEIAHPVPGRIPRPQHDPSVFHLSRIMEREYLAICCNPDPSTFGHRSFLWKFRFQLKKTTEPISTRRIRVRR